MPKKVLPDSNNLQTTASHYGVERMGVFGSVSRDEQGRDSDIDVAYEGKPDLFARIRMKHELEELFRCKVDIIRMSKQVSGSLFGQTISRELIYV